MTSHRQRNLHVGIVKMDGHSLKDCTKPQNQAQIDQCKKAFKEANKKNGGKGKGKGTWSPPKPEEKNRRVINGKQMFYVQKNQRWEIEQPAANAASNVPPPTPRVVPAAIPSSTSVTDPNKAGKELAVANYTHQINLAMQGIASAMRDA
jgi:hypothetical protein